MGRVVKMAFFSALGVCTGCAKPSKAPLTSVVPVIGLPPIQIDTTRPGIDVRSMPSAESIAATERTVRVAAEVESAMLERRPVGMGYPAAARQRHLAGEVRFRAIVGRDGNVEGLTLVEASDRVFVPIATASVQSWQYRPYVKDGRTIAVDTVIQVSFPAQ